MFGVRDESATKSLTPPGARYTRAALCISLTPPAFGACYALIRRERICYRLRVADSLMDSKNAEHLIQRRIIFSSNKGFDDFCPVIVELPHRIPCSSPY